MLTRRTLIMTKHLVVGTNPFNLVDDNGQRVQGVKVYYLDIEPEDGDNGAKGFFPLNLSIMGDHVSTFTSVPGIYDLEFKQKRDKMGKPSLSLRSVEFVKSVTLPSVI